MSETENRLAPGTGSELPPAAHPTVYRGTSSDVTALVAAVLGLLSVLSCATTGWMIYCLPIVPLILGIVGLTSARRAVDPNRSRILSWLGVGGGGLALLIVLAVFVIWAIVMFFSLVFPFFMMLLALPATTGGY